MLIRDRYIQDDRHMVRNFVNISLLQGRRVGWNAGAVATPRNKKRNEKKKYTTFQFYRLSF